MIDYIVNPAHVLLTDGNAYALTDDNTLLVAPRLAATGEPDQTQWAEYEQSGSVPEARFMVNLIKTLMALRAWRQS